jgi:hypothetical protein
MDLTSLSNEDLLDRVSRLRKIERSSLGVLLEHMAEVERRWARLPMKEPSLFAYCTRALGYSESEAYKRITVARLGAKFPIIIEAIKEGRVHLTTITILSPLFTASNCESLLAQAAGKTKREVQFIAADLSPRPDVPDSIHAGARGDDYDVIDPLSSSRVRFTFTAGARLLKMVDRARDILRHKAPTGRLEDIFGESLDTLLEKKDPERRLKRLEETGRQAPDPADCDPMSRRIPQGVRDAVWRRDGGQCSHQNPDGTRCPERGGLEFDHIVPHALGGPSNNAKNIRLLCRSHNRLAAIRVFGDAVTRRWTRPA